MATIVWNSWTSSSATDTCRSWGTADTTADTATWATWASWTEGHGAHWNWPEPASVDPVVQERARREARIKSQIRSEAQRRAEELLLAHLTPEQAKMYREVRRFMVDGSDGRQYEIDCNRHHQNITLLDGGRRMEELCIYAAGQVPKADNHLAQKLMLETDVTRLRQIANAFRVAG